ncbi:MAG TPA: hypothetical protein VGB65_13860 [Allosphingosinicella sp.]|jgi:hypothetical protein
MRTPVGTKLRLTWLSRCAVALLLLAGLPAAAQEAETVEGLGPENGEWELEYVGQFGKAKGTPDKRQHSGQSFYGVTDRLALGGETQLSYRSGPLVRNDRLYFDYDSAIAIFRFSDAEEDPIGLGLWVQAGLDLSDGELARLEAQLIAEKKTPRWWAQGNLMLRRVNERAQEGGLIAYAARGRRAVGPATWLGVEASGQAAELGGFRRDPLDKGHFIGPNLTHRIALPRDNDLQLGVAYLHRWDEHRGLRNLLQVSGTLRF